MDDLDDVVTLDEAAEIAGRSPVTMRTAAGRGKLRARKVGNPPHDVWITTRGAVSEYLAYVAEAAWYRQPQVIAQRRRRGLDGLPD